MNFNPTLILISLCFVGFSFLLHAQEVNADKDWPSFVKEVEQSGEWRLFYKSEDVEGISLPLPKEESQLPLFLAKQLKVHNLFVSHDREGNIFISPQAPLPTHLPTDFFKLKKDADNGDAIALDELGGDSLLMGMGKLPLPILKVGRDGTSSAGGLSLSGYLTNEEDGSPLLGVSMSIKELQLGTNSNEKGFYSLVLPKGSYTLLIQSFNFREETYEIQVFESGRLDFQLPPKLVELDGVVLTATRDEQVQGSQMGFERLSAANIKEIPLVMGERDVLKVAQLLPGIQTVGEGASGFNVRGSPADQNLFYINHVPIYNTSHLFGFFSAFNSDAISEFSIAKSSIPAKYGGRLASIFEVSTKQGNKNRFSANGGISPITGRLLVEGPIQKGKSSFLVAGRTTYSNWILRQIDNLDFQRTQAGFRDAIAHLTLDQGKNDKLSLFGYFSTDNINFAGRTSYNYQNAGASLSWFHLIGGKHSLQLSAVRSQYGLEVANSELPVRAYRQDNQLIHNEIKSELSLRPNNQHEIRLGANAIYYDIDRGSHLPLTDSSAIIGQDLGEEQALEAGIFISDLWKPNKFIAVEAGLRYNHYVFLGPQRVLTYQEGSPKTVLTIQDTLSYGQLQPIQTYQGLDFRISSRFLLREYLSAKASYNRLHQYIFLLSNTIALAPSDKWKLTDSHIRPMVGDQFSVGLYATHPQKGLQVSLEGYVKNVQNLVEFRDGVELIVNENPEQDVLQGQLRAYGVEFLLKKPFGRFNGWISYAYSRSLAQVSNSNPELQVNAGQVYPANFDKPHALNLVSNYKFTRRLSISGNIVYATGRPITYPTQIFYQNGVKILSYSKRNEYRIPDYFRIDASIKLEGNLRSKKLLHGSWILSVYNLLGRDNPYSVFFTGSNQGNLGYQLSIFATPVVSLTYDFKLGNYAN